MFKWIYEILTLLVYKKNKRAQQFYLNQGFKIKLQRVDEKNKE